VGEETVYTKHRKLPLTSKHYKQSSLHSSVLVIVGVPFGVKEYWESEEFFRLTGQLAQPNQDYVFSKRAAFFNGLKSKVGHIMAKTTALRVNLNLAPSIPSTPRPPTRKLHAHLLYALNLSHHVLPPHGA